VAEIIASAIDGIFEDTSVSEIFGARTSPEPSPAPGAGACLPAGAQVRSRSNLGNRPHAPAWRSGRRFTEETSHARITLVERPDARWLEFDAPPAPRGQIPGVIYGTDRAGPVAVEGRELRIPFPVSPLQPAP